MKRNDVALIVIAPVLLDKPKLWIPPAGQHITRLDVKDGIHARVVLEPSRETRHD